MNNPSPVRQTGAAHLAQAMRGAGVEVVTAVPGFGPTQVFEAWSAPSIEPSFCYHEEVALTIAHGAALVGIRAVTLCKAHGLAKAANSALDALSAGTTAGFVITVFNDAEGRHSDSILDAEGLVRGLNLPVVIATDGLLQSALVEAVTRSEKQALPCALVVDADAVTDSAEEVPQRVSAEPPPYRRSPAHHVLSPVTAPFHDRVLNAKRAGENWKALEPPRRPRVPGKMKDEWRETLALYEPFFEVFSEYERGIAAGDTGLSSLFAHPPYEAVDITTYMGGSVPLAIGSALAGKAPAWALTGDFSFVAAGHLGLLEATRRDLPIHVVIFANGRAEATGGQAVPPRDLVRLLAGYRSETEIIVSPTDEDVLRRRFERVMEAEGLTVTVLDYEGHLAKHW